MNGFLADDPRHAGGYRLFDHRDMRFRRCRDIPYVDPAAVQKRGEIGVAPTPSGMVAAGLLSATATRRAPVTCCQAAWWNCAK